MKNKIYLILTFLLCQFVNAQNVGVEKSISTIQMGFLGVWINHESRLSNQIALRSELGFDGGVVVVIWLVKQFMH
jgi:hypothetical protein